MNQAVSSDLLEQAVAAMDAGDAERAYPLAAALCERSPTDFQAHHVAGIAALDTDRAGDALRLFRHALRLAPTTDLAAVAWWGIGRAQLLRESPHEGTAAFLRALSLSPSFGPAFGGLAEALGNQGRHYEAEQAGKRALELGVDEARLHVALGHAYLGQDKLEDAEREFRAAAALDANAPEPRFGLGSLAKIQGNFTEADRIYRTVLAETPDYPGYEQFAGLKRYSRQDPDLEMIERRFAELPPDAPRSARADLNFALAKVYDDIDDTERATRHLEEGNRLERQRMVFDPGQDDERVRRLADFVTRDFIERYADAGLAGVQPVFVISLPRSGSTLTEQMLASHPQIRGGGELGHVTRIAAALGAKWATRPDFPDIEETAARQDLREAAREYSQLTAALRLLEPRFTDKSLNNFFYIGLIRVMLPDARIVHVRRHPLATALGLYRVRFARGITYNSDLSNIAAHYRAYARMMDHWRNVAPEAFIELRYERLVAEPEIELRRLLSYIGLEFDPACLEFYKLHRPVRTASVTQVRQPLDLRGLTRHERYRDLLRPVAESLSEEIADYENELAAELGYAGPPAGRELE